MKSYKYRCELYKHTVTFCFDLCTFNKLTDNGVVVADGYCHHKFNRPSDVVIYVRHIDFELNIPAMTHECFHSADVILSTVGVKFDDKTDNEAYAYMIELLVKKGLHFWGKYNKEFNLCGK